jgi:hypothetical protein
VLAQDKAVVIGSYIAMQLGIPAALLTVSEGAAIWALVLTLFISIAIGLVEKAGELLGLRVGAITGLVLRLLPMVVFFTVPMIFAGGWQSLQVSLVEGIGAGLFYPIASGAVLAFRMKVRPTDTYIRRMQRRRRG